jgi:DNA-binding response OmpR family regulator
VGTKKEKPSDKIKVLIADDDRQMALRLTDHLVEHGFDVRTAANGKTARAEILAFKPKFVLADLMLPEGNALDLIDFVKQEKSLRHSMIHVIVASGHNLASNVQMALRRGAKDYLVKPFRHEDVLKRLVFHSRNYRGLEEVHANDFQKFDESGLMLHLTDLVLRQALGKEGLNDILFNLTRMVSMKVDGVRCSIVQCLDQKTGVVVVSNDDRAATGIRLDLYKYPEVLHVMNTNALIAIENIDNAAELRHIKDYLKEVTFNSMILCPVSRRNEPFGVLSLRLPPIKTTITDNEIRFVEIVGHVISLVLSSEVHRDEDNFWSHPARGLLSFTKKS